MGGWKVGMVGDSTSHSHHRSWHQGGLGTGLGDPPVPHRGAALEGCHPPGSEGWDLGAFRAAQQDKAAICGAGGAETSLLGTAGCLTPPPACRRALLAWQRWLRATSQHRG